MRAYCLLTRDVPVHLLDEFDEVLDSDGDEPEPEVSHSSAEDVQAFISRFGGGEVTVG